MIHPHPAHRGHRGDQRARLLRLIRIRWKRAPVRELVMAGVLLAAAGALAWHLMQPHDMPSIRALREIDQVLVQQWGSLPTPTQEALRATYARLGLAPPGQRQ